MSGNLSLNGFDCSREDSTCSRRQFPPPNFPRIHSHPTPERDRSVTEAALAAAVGGRPSRLPCDRACAKPARSRRMSLSNSAKTESSPAIARPAGVVRSRASVTETKTTSSAVSSCNVDTRSATDRPHRSNRQTRTTSMSRRRAESISRSRIARDRTRAHFLTSLGHRPATLQSGLPQRAPASTGESFADPAGGSGHRARAGRPARSRCSAPLQASTWVQA